MILPTRGLLAALTLFAGAAAAGLNHDPVDDVAITSRGRPVTVDVLANDPGVTPATVLRVHRQPGHGSAAVVERRVVYAPAPGFVGRDRVEYWVKTGRSFGVAGVDVVVGDVLVIDGAVPEAGAGATVSASVGGRNVQTISTHGGRYSLDVIGLPDEMVTLAASAGQLVVLGLPGGFARLRAEAGADGVLTRDENSQVQLSRLSAALAYQLQLANGGAAIASEGELQQALGAFDAASLLDGAGAIKLVVDGRYVLPAGVADTMALISDHAAFEAFTSVVDPDALSEAVSATLLDDSVLPRPRLVAMPGARSFARPAVDGNVRLGMLHGERLELQAGGNGRYHGNYPTTDDAAGWSFAAGTVRVEPDVPAAPERLAWIDGREIRQQTMTDRLDYRLVVDGGASGRDLFAVTSHVRTHYPDHPEIPDVIDVSTSPRLAYRDGVASIGFVSGDLPGVRTLPRHLADVQWGVGDLDHGTGGALHRFHADGTGRVIDGGAFTWSVDADGNLALVHADGVRLLVRRLQQDGRKGDGVLASFVLPDGRVKSHHALSVVQDGSLVFDGPALARPWRSGFTVTQPAHDAWSHFHVVLDGPAQTGYTHSLNEGVPTTHPLSWRLEAGRMIARHYRDHSGPRVECTEGVNGCYIRSERRWVPIAASGNRIYVLEELWFAGAPGQALALGSQRATFYELAPSPLP